MVDANKSSADRCGEFRRDNGNALYESSLDVTQKVAEAVFAEFLSVILPDWDKDPNMKGTPARVSKMYIRELLAGVYGEEPKITSFENVDKYTGMVFEGDIQIKSMCSHHLMPFEGKAYIAYIPKDRIIGLSKLNRIAEYFSRRAQVQENLTMQIHDYIVDKIGDNLGVAVYIEAKHLCVSHRGAKNESVMKTAKLSGLFYENKNGARDEFYNMIRK